MCSIEQVTRVRTFCLAVDVVWTLELQIETAEYFAGAKFHSIYGVYDKLYKTVWTLLMSPAGL